MRSSSILLLFCLSLGQLPACKGHHAHHGLNDAEMMSHDGADALVTLGYDPSLVQRLRSRRPEIVTQILSEKNAGREEAARPITVYRGVSLALDRYDPQFRSGTFSTDAIYTARDPAYAMNYGRALNGARYGIVMELQVPTFLVSVEEAQSGGFIDMTEVMVPTAIFPDDRDFMTRLGYLVPLGHRERRNPDFIRWRSFDQVWNSGYELKPEALTVPEE